MYSSVLRALKYSMRKMYAIYLNIQKVKIREAVGKNQKHLRVKVCAGYFRKQNKIKCIGSSKIPSKLEIASFVSGQSFLFSFILFLLLRR